MLSAFTWGLVASGAYVLGGLLGIAFSFGKRTLGIIMAFGAGTLISAIAYELILDSVKIAVGTGVTAFGFLLGAAVFFGCDNLVGRIGAGKRKSIDTPQSSNLAAPLVLAAILDGVPESTVVGVSILDGNAVSLAVLVAVFISNLPEAIVSTNGMVAGAWSRTSIVLLWLGIAIVCGIAAALGYVLLDGASDLWLALFKAFAAGAILMMLANTMMPEAFNHGGRLAGVFTVLGFTVSVFVVLLERT